MIVSTFNQSEISPNPFQDSFRFGWAERGIEPFNRVFRVFSVIATVNPMTQWYDVQGDRTGAIRTNQRYPVIHSESVPQADRSSAYRATMDAVDCKSVFSELPVISCECIGETSLPGKPTMRRCGSLIGIPFAVISIISRVFITKFLVFYLDLFFVAIVKPLIKSTLLVCSLILLSRSLSAFGVVFVILYDRFTAAFTTLARKTVSISLIDMKIRPYQPLMTFSAFAEGTGNIQHHNILSLLPSNSDGPELGNPVVKRLISPLQARLQYSTDRSVR